MAYSKGLHPGATWKKTDFQIHTPRDPQWSGSPHLPGGTPDFESERDRWADEFVQKCIAEGLQAIAVTDHHDFCFVPYVSKAIERLPEGQPRPWLYPGVEVTCIDAVQCLVLFDVATDVAIWNRLYGGHLNNIEAPDLNEQVAPQAINCGKEIRSFLEGVDADTTLNKVSIVLPHASNDGAHKSMLRQGFNVRFASIPFDGVYTDKAYQQLEQVPKNKIHGKIAEWGNRRRGILPTGDNRKANFERLGAHGCWVRLGEPTVESIRQALLADEARIAYEPPVLPSQRILAMHVRSTLTGENFELSFNDGFNAFIGGRGSGKTALLEYLRFGLGRSSIDTDPTGEARERGSDSRERERGLVQTTLATGAVTVIVERDGVVETWTRSLEKKDVITVAVDGSGSEEITIVSAQQRFRARAFYQKQLSTIVIVKETAAEQITGIAAAELVDRRRVCEEDIESAKREVQSAFQQVVKFWVAEAAHSKALQEVADLRRRLEAIKKRLEEAGLTPENQAIIEVAPKYNRAEALFTEAQTAIALQAKLLQTQPTRPTGLDAAAWVDIVEFEEAAKFQSAIVTTQAEIAEKFASIVGLLQNLETQRDTLSVEFAAKLKEFRAKHEAAKAEQANLSALIADSTRLTAELQGAEVRERQAETQRQELSTAPQSLNESRAALALRIAELKTVLEGATASVAEMSHSVLRAQVQNEVTPAQYMQAIHEICDGLRFRDLPQKCEWFIGEVIRRGDGAWEEFHNRVMAVYRHKVQSGGTAEPGEETTNTIRAAFAFDTPLTEVQVAGIYSRLDDVRMSRLLTATPESFIAFEYQDRGNYIPFEQASPGQQAAALLNLLLNQEAGTLIIDQPEDDLDNKVVMDIVKLLQTTKRRRQLIFATHNPNFVVNGDADKIVALVPGGTDHIATPRIDIEADGAIETPKVRTAITETMEGGQLAFELRSRKYAFRGA